MSDLLSQKVSTIFLNVMEYLECPVCLDFAVSPIYTCPNGHILCGICQETIKICPMCQADRLVVNAFVERILKAEGVTFPCRNELKGCSLEILPAEMKDHLKTCDFRLIRCCEEDCDNKSDNQQELFKHLVKIHKVKRLNAVPAEASCESDVSSEILGSVTRKMSISKAQYENKAENGGLLSWPVVYLDLDDRTFLVHCKGRGEKIYLWLTLLGEESIANRYKYTITLNRLSKCGQNIQIPEIPVHSLHHHEIGDVEALGHTASVNCNALKLMMNLDQQPENRKIFVEWEFRIDISKAEVSNN